jgi:hypothetical protein
MDLQVEERSGVRWLAGPPGQPLLHHRDDVLDLVSACAEHGVDRVLLDAANLPPGFVDLSTGVAGHILLKLQIYRIRLVVVLSLAATPHSPHFAAFTREANRGRDFHVAGERAAAEAWLIALSKPADP